MALGKWIGGFLGWMTGGPIGALAGIVLGGMFETMFGPDAQEQHNAFDASGRFAQETANLGQRNSFLFSLLVLSSYIIRADGKIMHSEMETVRRMLRQNFGETAVQQGDVILRRLFDEQNRVGDAQFRQTVNQCCQQMARNMGYAQRLQLLNFLVMIAKADGRVADEEVAAVKEVARWLQVAVSEVESMLGLGGNTLEDAYRVLGLSPSATDSEVKKAYRRLALEHHPDRVASLGDDVRQAAEKKFKEINAAKELIYKTRGL